MIPALGQNTVNYKTDFAGIPFNVVKNGDSNRRYIWIHGDEETARLALEGHILNRSGIAFFIQNSEREVLFNGGNVDPNRVFSRMGARENLFKYNPHWTESKFNKTLDSLDSGRAIFIENILPPDQGLLIALHNNLRGYSIKDEIPLSDEVSIKQDQDERNFYLCTNREDYEILAASPFNVVLQETLPEKDDGSLSWLAVRKKVRYINIEVRLGYLSIQKKMLAYLEENLD